jgi:hypothetical protein
MMSDFIVNHPKMSLFSLTDEEYKKAVRKEPWLEHDSKLNFLKKYNV